MAFGSISNLWNKWNTRSFVILSLSLQVFLIMFAPLRKKTANYSIIFLLWLAYLMADWVAAFTIGLISHSQDNSSAYAAEIDGALQAFWASFLLLHLGGQDTITAFSMEDGCLWRRHLLTLIFQVGATIYVFTQLFPNDKSLVIPTMLVFLAAFIKNVERTLALHLSSLPKLRESMLTQHKNFDAADNKIIEELNSLSGGISTQQAEPAESTVVKYAYFFFQIFKVFLADGIFTCQERNLSRECFHKISAVDALRVISVELHFMYEVLHTKALIIRSKWSCIFRFIAFTVIVMAFITFNRLKKHHLPKLDVEITYILLFGGIALDVISLLMLLFSDWTIAGIMRYNQGSFLNKLVLATDNLRKSRLATCEAESNVNVTYRALDTSIIFQRWSESISACNLLSESLKESPRKFYKCVWSQRIIAFSNICNFPRHMAEKIISRFHQAGEIIAGGWGPRNTERKIPMIWNTKYMSKNPFIMELWTFIFGEVRGKSELVNTAEIEVKEIFEARGDLFLRRRPEGINCTDLLVHVTANYDASIIKWHLATEILYSKETPTIKNDHREFSKILSDYMFYLLLNQCDVVSTVAGIARMRSAETLCELRALIPCSNLDIEALCKALFELPPGNMASRSQLRDGIKLAQQLENLRETKWKVMSGVWVEMLSYAATHIKGEKHVQVLSKGGELLAFVWLLMAHFGCFYKPEMGMYFEHWYEGMIEATSSRG